MELWELQEMYKELQKKDAEKAKLFCEELASGKLMITRDGLKYKEED